MIPSVTDFDLVGAAERIRARMSRTAEDIVEIGRDLIAVKKALGHGHFLKWIDAEFGMSERTARNFMGVAEKFKSATVTDFSPSVLYALAAPSTPDEVREEVTRRAGAGEKVTADEVKRLKAETINSAPTPALAEKPKNARTVMADRVGEDDGLYPTPPYATRALIERVLPALGLSSQHLGNVLDPACGEGHITGVLEEYVTGGTIYARDIEARAAAPGWAGASDFLDDRSLDLEVDWIITNPPFGEKSLAFAQIATDRANVGLALFLPLRWLETIGRYENLFRDRPPTLVAPFVERVNLCKGRWDPDGSTATAYMWLVWVHEWSRSPRPLFWIPPGCRKALARPDDVERFTARPVKACTRPAGAEARANFLDVPKPYAPGDAVQHEKYGTGTVVAATEVKVLTIDFDGVERKIIDSFVRSPEPTPAPVTAGIRSEESDPPTTRKALPLIQHEEDLASVVAGAFSEIEELASECRGVVENAPAGLDGTDRIQTFDSTAEILESLSPPAVAEALRALRCSYTTTKPRKGRGLSRAARCGDAIGMLQAVVDVLGDIGEEDPRHAEAIALIGDLEEAISEAEGAEFPGMFG